MAVRNLKLCYGQTDNREIVIEVPTNTNPYTFHFPMVKAIGKTRKETRDQKMHLTWGIDISKDFEPEGERIDSSSPRTLKSSSVKRLQMHTNH